MIQEMPGETVTKRLYLVRHGETTYNKENRSQPASAPLSAKGCVQSALLARRFRKIAVEKIFSSDMTRALETAQWVAKTTQKLVVVTPLLREMRRPSEVTEHVFTDPSIQHIREAMRAHILDREWRYSDEENLFDLCARAREAEMLLRAEYDKNLVVVTHGMFMKMFLCALLLAEDTVAVDMYAKIRWSFYVNNAAITVVEYGSEHGVERWRLRVWNDHAHLG